MIILLKINKKACEKKGDYGRYIYARFMTESPVGIDYVEPFKSFSAFNSIMETNENALLK